MEVTLVRRSEPFRCGRPSDFSFRIRRIGREGTDFGGAFGTPSVAGDRPISASGFGGSGGKEVTLAGVRNRTIFGPTALAEVHGATARRGPRVLPCRDERPSAQRHRD